MEIENLNKYILGFKDKDVNVGAISDGYHTFDELYEHRIVLYMAVCRLTFDLSTAETLPVWMSSVHSDGSRWDGWFILGIYYTPGHQITYHLPSSYWDECAEFARVLDKAPEFDGHTSQDVLERLKEL